MSKNANDEFYEFVSKFLTVKDIKRIECEARIRVWFLKLKTKIVEKFKRIPKERGGGEVSVQNCSTCRNWEVCKGSMQVGVDCYKPTKEEIIRQELMKNPKVKAEFSKMIDLIIPCVANVAKAIIDEIPNIVSKIED